MLVANLNGSESDLMNVLYAGQNIHLWDLLLDRLSWPEIEAS